MQTRPNARLDGGDPHVEKHGHHGMPTTHLCRRCVEAQLTHRIRRVRAEDEAAIIAFAQGLPEHDLLFLGRDLRQPRVVRAWMRAIGSGRIDSIVAETDSGVLMGTAALVRDPLSWSAHVGEVRLLVGTGHRGAGIGRDMLQAILAIAGGHGLEKLTAAMTTDQINSIVLFESLGFRGEARLKDQVRDPSGNPHDLVILAQTMAQVGAKKKRADTAEPAAL